MATRYIGSTNTAPSAGRTSDIVGAASGGTLAGSQKVQIVFDDTVYDSTQEGKQRLVAEVEQILDCIKVARTWPIDTAS